MVCSRLAPMLQPKAELLNSEPIALLCTPPDPVRPICGKKAARAASTLAWALARLASAWATAGGAAIPKAGPAPPRALQYDRGSGRRRRSFQGGGRAEWQARSGLRAPAPRARESALPGPTAALAAAPGRAVRTRRWSPWPG